MRRILLLSKSCGPLSPQHKKLVNGLAHYGDKESPAPETTATDPRTANLEVRTCDVEPLLSDSFRFDA